MRWKSLRDTYIKESRKQRERRDKSGGGAAGTAVRWRYLAVLSFLEPSVAPRRSSGNMAERRGQEEDAGYPEEPAVEAGLPGLSNESVICCTRLYRNSKQCLLFLFQLFPSHIKHSDTYENKDCH